MFLLVLSSSILFTVYHAEVSDNWCSLLTNHLNDKGDELALYQSNWFLCRHSYETLRKKIAKKASKKKKKKERKSPVYVYNKLEEKLIIFNA